MAAVDEACEPVDIPPESRTVGQQPIEPAQIPPDEAHHRTDEEHGEKRPEADDIPLPRTEKEVAGHNTQGDERRIDGDFHPGEIDARVLKSRMIRNLGA